MRPEIGGVAVTATVRRRRSATGISTVAPYGTLVIEAPVQGANQVTSSATAVIKETLQGVGKVLVPVTTEIGLSRGFTFVGAASALEKIMSRLNLSF